MNRIISIAKAIAIILMVVGHSGCPELLNQFIYVFHMPLFFMVSGYLFKDKYLSEPLNFIKHKIKGLYIPFVKWSLIFLILHNLLFSLGCYSTRYTWGELGVNAVRYIAMLGSEQLLGGYWFLKELLISSIVSYFIIRTTKFTTRYIPIALLLLVLAYVISVLGIDFPLISSRTFIACFMFISGYFIKIKRIDARLHSWYIPVVGYSVCLITVVNVDDLSGMGVVGWRILPYVIAALFGSLSTYSLSGYIDKYMPKLAGVLTYIGECTFYILTFHFVSFKIVSWFLIRAVGADGKISDFPVVPNLSGSWWILYTAIGVLVPIMLWSLSNIRYGKIMKMANYKL